MLFLFRFQLKVEKESVYSSRGQKKLEVGHGVTAS